MANHTGGAILNTGYALPDKGDRIEQRRTGVTRAGTVWYADQLQVLVKWDDGRTSSLRIGRDHFVRTSQLV